MITWMAKMTRMIRIIRKRYKTWTADWVLNKTRRKKQATDFVYNNSFRKVKLRDSRLA